MEKRSTSYYFVLFGLVIFTILLFGTGTGAIAVFNRTDKPSFFSAIGVPLLGAVAFVLGYFVNVFGAPNSTKTLRRAASPLVIWMMLLLVFMILFRLNQDHPIRLFFSNCLAKNV
jgi:hypothetical protein